MVYSGQWVTHYIGRVGENVKDPGAHCVSCIISWWTRTAIRKGSRSQTFGHSHVQVLRASQGEQGENRQGQCSMWQVSEGGIFLAMVWRMWLGRKQGEAFEGRLWGERRQVAPLVGTKNTKQSMVARDEKFGKKYMLGSLETHKLNHITLDHLSTETSNLFKGPLPFEYLWLWLWHCLSYSLYIWGPESAGKEIKIMSELRLYHPLSLTKVEVQSNRWTRFKYTLNLNFIKELQKA